VAGELILIVEDNEKNLKLVRDYLQVKGYQMRKAAQRKSLRLRLPMASPVATSPIIAKAMPQGGPTCAIS
jgi:CheY-like chemotaxis protein